MSQVIRNGRIEEGTGDDHDFEMLSPNQMHSSHINTIPIQSAVQSTRLFYGARFLDQAVPVVGSEQPMVQNLVDGDPDGRSFDELAGDWVGTLKAPHEGTVKSVTPEDIELEGPDGVSKMALYRDMPFNRKTGISHRPVVKPGDKVTKGGLLAASNYTDDKGTMAMGLNARIGLVPFKGFSMDDATVISANFARKLRSEHTYTYDQDFDDDTRSGLNHFKSLFPDKFKKDQLALLDENGVAKPNSIIKPGDPIILATRPRIISSTSAQIGKLSRSMQQARSDASTIWDKDDDAIVTDVAHTKDGVKVILKSLHPTREADKVVLRSGQKGTVSQIIPDEQMPRTLDGRPLDMLLNPLGIPSRANSALIFELLAGKVADAQGAPVKLPAFNKPGEKWHEIIGKMLGEKGLSSREQIYDPVEGRLLDNPITVGHGYVLKLHHTAACFDKDTEVLTSRGWKFWKDVTMSDELATSDVAGQSLTFEKPLHLFSYDYSGNLCAFEGRYVDYAVTPNHNLWCKFYYGERTFSLRPAASLHNKRFKLKQFGLIPTCPGGAEFKIIGDFRLPWDDFCELVGWWVTEGCVSTSKSHVLVYQSLSANPAKVARIEELIKRLGMKWSYYKDKGEIKGFHILNKDLATYLGKFGSHSQFKTVPREVVEGRLSGCKRAMEAMMLGDGNHQDTPTGPHDRLYSTSKQLVDDFQEMAIRTGVGSIIKPVSRDTKKFKENPHYLAAWVASFTTRRDTSQVDGDRNDAGFKLLPYNGKVFCAEMSSGLLYVRRNGKPMLSGNSKEDSRATGGYDSWQQPLKGGGPSAGAKRLSGLDVSALMSAGAYANLREGATLRGQRNDEYWRGLRTGQNVLPKKKPFAWDKYRAFLVGAGLRTKDEGEGKMRLGPVTDADLDNYNPVEIQHGGMVDLRTLEAHKGGLFDPGLVGANRWGKITLPHAVPNPAFESAILQLLGLKKQELRAIMAGELEMPTKR